MAARLETGYPPGITPPPFARLIGQPAPAFSLDGLQGSTVSSDHAPAGRPWLLFFAEASCQACDATYPAFARASERYPVIVVGAGDPSVLREKLAPHGLVPVAGHDRRWEVNQAYGVPGYPSVLLIDPQGVVRPRRGGQPGSGAGACAGEEGLSMAAHRPSLLAGGLLALALTGALAVVDGPPGSLLNRLPRSCWRRLNGHQLIPHVVDGDTFVDGELQLKEAA